MNVVEENYSPLEMLATQIYDEILTIIFKNIVVTAAISFCKYKNSN